MGDGTGADAHGRHDAALPELPLCTLCLSTGGINGCPSAEGYGRNHRQAVIRG